MLSTSPRGCFWTKDEKRGREGASISARRPDVAKTLLYPSGGASRKRSSLSKGAGLAVEAILGENW